MPARFSASIVLYNNDADLLAPAIESTLRTPGLETLYLVDNSVPVKDFLDTLIAGNSVPARSGCQAGLRRVVLASHLCR